MSVLNGILSALPYVLSSVLTVEQTIGSQPGATKKAIILSSIDAAAKVGEQVPVPLVSGISALIDNLVAVLNNSGVFSHETAAPTPHAAS